MEKGGCEEEVEEGRVWGGGEMRGEVGGGGGEGRVWEGER